MMVKFILEALKLHDFYGVSESIEIAKGCNKLEKNYKGIYRQKVRKLKWQIKE